MANVVVVDGIQYINVDKLVEEMVKEVVSGTETNDMYIMESERDNLSAYQDLCTRLAKDVPNIKARFKIKYVNERFVVRTLKD